MKRFIFLLMLLPVAAVLAGCSGGTDPVGAAPAGAVPVVAATQAVEAAAPDADTGVTAAERTGATLGETLVDEQGAIAVSVKPLNIGPEAGTLDFEVSMNTHSVDLSMDLASLATLTTDTGEEVAASSWDAPSGGHHTSGVLSFPADSAGASLLEGATTLTLTLVDVDAPARTFTWTLQ